MGYSGTVVGLFLALNVRVRRATGEPVLQHCLLTHSPDSRKPMQRKSETLLQPQDCLDQEDQFRGWPPFLDLKPTFLSRLTILANEVQILLKSAVGNKIR